jgi:predicted transcriptional regulator
MKKLFFFIITLAISQYCSAVSAVEVGKKMPLWEPLLAESNDLSRLNSCKDKVELIYHIDPRHKDENTDAIFAVRDALEDGRLSLKSFQPIAIIECDTIWQPNGMIRRYAKRQNEKMPELDSILIFDYKGQLKQKYTEDFDDDFNCIILVDKQGVCRAIFRNKMSKDQIKELVDMAVELQHPSPAAAAAAATENEPKERPKKLEVGRKAPSWMSILRENNLSFKAQCDDKVLLIDYIDPMHNTQSIPAVQAVQRAVKKGRLSLKDFQAVGILDCENTHKSGQFIENFDDKEEATLAALKPILLYDINGVLGKKYESRPGKKNKNCLILVDKQGICRAIYRDKMTKKQIKDLVNMAVKLQHPENKLEKPPKSDNGIEFRKTVDLDKTPETGTNSTD